MRGEAIGRVWYCDTGPLLVCSAVGRSHLGGQGEVTGERRGTVGGSCGEAEDLSSITVKLRRS